MEDKNLENNKWIVDGSFAYQLHETGRYTKGVPEQCNKFYFRVYPDYAHGITDEDAAKVVSELIRTKEERELLIEALKDVININNYKCVHNGYLVYSKDDEIINRAKELLNNLNK